MGKHDAFSPKALANKMKAKGLQKLRWYCQMCEKQCRDENGFKCHLTSDGHMRMMQVFSENPKSFIEDFSKQFEKGFMDIVRRKWRTKRVFANKVYQEYIADKEHIHMNGTRWESLAGFVMYLGRSGKCHVDETPKGWYIKYIERDPEVLARQEMIKQKERMDADDEMRNQKLIEKQLEFLQGEGAPAEEEVAPVNEFKREDDSQKIQLALNVAKPKKVVAAVNPFEAATKAQETKANGVKEEKLENIKSEKHSSDKKSRSRSRERDRSRSRRSRSRSRSRSKDRHHRRDRSRSRDRKSSDKDRRRDRSRDRRSRSRSRSRDNKNRDSGHKRKYDDIKDRKDDDTSNKKQKTEHNGTNGSSNNNTKFMDDLIKNQELKREKEGRKPFWLHPNIIVKIMNKDLANGKYFKQKGLVKEVFDKYVALVEILDDGTKIKIDQQDLETVIPNVGGAVMIVNGAYRGETAVLQSLEIDKFKAVVQIDKGPNRGHTLQKEYEDVCKLNV